MSKRRNPAADRVRHRIRHPIIDADGHCIEYLPVVYEYAREIGGESAAKGLRAMFEAMRQLGQLTPEQRRALGVMRPPWWAFPARNTLDRATAMLPRLLYERLDELGLDFAVVYPTYGLVVFNIEDDELRRVSARAFNRYFADHYRESADRLAPVAIIPMNTPEEALAELDYAHGELGLKASLLAGHVMRPVAAAGESPRPMLWMDTFGADSPHDYDPVWRRCLELGVSPAFHSAGMGWGSRASPSSYVFNHIGNFAAAGEAICRALLLDGVPRRYPRLRFAFLEGGVGWAATLYADAIGHFSKRNAESVQTYNPNAIDRDELLSLFREYGDGRISSRLNELDDGLWPIADPAERKEGIDEFAASGIQRVEDIRDVFRRSFFFGCEADDPTNAAAFDARRNPMNARLNAIFSSDIGHWDVPDNRAVLAEAFELVEKGMLTEEDFRDFTFANAVSLYTGTNPDFFKGTVLEHAVARTR